MTQHENVVKKQSTEYRALMEQAHNITRTPSVALYEMVQDHEAIAQTILAMANSGGGIILFGVREQEPKVTLVGLKREELINATEFKKEMEHYLPETLHYEVHTLDYTTDANPNIRGKIFQLLDIKDVPTHIPFLPLKSGELISESMVYVRDAQSNASATYAQIQDLLGRRLQTGYSASQLPLDEHLKQLRVLYGHISSYEHVSHLLGVDNLIHQSTAGDSSAGSIEHEFDAFVLDLIDQKKKIIRDLTLRT